MTAPPPYHIAPSPGKGLGVFASRRIKIGELIIRESPMFIVAPTETIHQALARVSAADHQAFFALRDCFKPTSPTPETIFETNCWLCNQSDNPPVAVNEIMSKFNHSCEPNASNQWQPVRAAMEAYAAKPIKRGEEITIQYIDVNQSREDRRDHLQRRWGFLCQCEICRSPNVESSDERREEIAGSREVLFFFRNLGSSTLSMLHIAKSVIRMIEREYGPSPADLFEAHHDAGEVSAMLSNASEVHKHAGLGYAYALLARGPEDQNTRALHAYRRNPSTSPNFGRQAAVVSSPLCDYCGDEGASEECSQCGCTIYCDDECEDNHRRVHAPACNVLRRTIA